MGSDGLEREREHHDHWAAEIDVDRLDVRTSFEGSTAPENRFIMAELGPVQGKDVLDIGCGAGEGGVYFALHGARCTCIDYSPGMVETAGRLAARYGVAVEGKVMNAMVLDFPDNSFDIVYAANLLHHVDPLPMLREMHRVVRPGGKVCFWDPLRHNPVINVYRRMATKVRSADERPVDIRLVDTVRGLFSEVHYDTFWLATLWIFLRFYLVEHVDPNKERYWKKILDEEERLRPLYRKLERVDRGIKKVPFLRRYAWNLAVVATK